MPAAAPIILGTIAVIGTGYMFKKVRPPCFFPPWLQVSCYNRMPMTIKIKANLLSLSLVCVRSPFGTVHRVSMGNIAI